MTWGNNRNEWSLTSVSDVGGLALVRHAVQATQLAVKDAVACTQAPPSPMWLWAG